MKRPGSLLGLMVILASSESFGEERRVYEGVVDLKGKTIGTLILLEPAGDSLKGWIRLEKFVPVEGGGLSEKGAEFRAAGNRYEIDERKGRISYSGPDGEGSRYVTRLSRLTGLFDELTEESHFSGANIAAVEVEGRRRDLRVGRPALWKRVGPPFETFERVEELLGKQVSVWVADINARTGRIVAVEEPAGMDIPLKAPKKPKEKKQEKKQDKEPVKPAGQRPFVSAVVVRMRSASFALGQNLPIPRIAAEGLLPMWDAWNGPRLHPGMHNLMIPPQPSPWGNWRRVVAKSSG